MRLFIALPLPNEIKLFLEKIINDLKEHCPDRKAVKWVDAKNIHLTVKFLGETGESQIDSIIKDIDKISTQFSPIKCVINKIGAFPNLKRPRIFWAGLQTTNDDLIKLAGKTDKTMTQHGFERETRSFKAHLTLGRVRDNSRGLIDLTSYMNSYEVEKTTLQFDRLTLSKSTLTPQGPIYEKLHEAVLGEERFG